MVGNRLLTALIPMLLVCSSCSSTLKIFSPVTEDGGAIRLAEVVYLGKRHEITALEDVHQHLLTSGIQDSDLQDGSVVVARVYCCGGLEEQLQIWIYVPPSLPVEVGNIIEVRMGRSPSENDHGAVNTAVRVRQRGISNGSCRWVPEQQGLWMRILYCDWMKEEGWIERTGLDKAWLKPAVAGKIR